MGVKLEEKYEEEEGMEVEEQDDEEVEVEGGGDVR